MPGNRIRLQHLLPLAAVQVFGILCGVVGVRWTTTVIPPQLLGLYGLLLSGVQAGLVVTHQGIIKHVQRTWTSSEPARPYLRGLVAASRAPTVWLGGGAVVIAFTLHITGGVPFHPGVVAWLIVANLGVVAGVALQAALQAEQRYWPNFAANAVASATRSFAPPLLVMLVGATLAVVSTAFLLHTAAVIAFGAWLLRGAWSRPAGAAETSPEALRRLVRSFAAVGLASWLASAAPRWLAATVLSADGVGYFVLAGNLALIIPAAVGAIVLSVTFPAIFSAARTADARETWRLTTRAIVVVLGTTQAGLLVLWLATPWLIGPIIHQRYALATDWLLATGGAALAATTGQFFHNLLLAREREKACLKISLLSCAVRVAAMLAACHAGAAAFRGTLIALPWLTVGVEYWYARREFHRSLPARYTRRRI